MTKITNSALIERGFIVNPYDDNWLTKKKSNSDTDYGISIFINKNEDIFCITIDGERVSDATDIPIDNDTSLEDLDHLIRILKL